MSGRARTAHRPRIRKGVNQCQAQSQTVPPAIIAKPLLLRLSLPSRSDTTGGNSQAGINTLEAPVTM
jgi:hypothetical protein